MRNYRNFSSYQQYAEKLCDKLSRWLRRKSRRISEELVKTTLILLGLDLEPSREILKATVRLYLPVYPVPSGTAEKVSEDGRPICPAGKLMRWHFYDKKKHKIL